MEKPIDTEEFLLTVAEILTQGVPNTVQPMDEETFFKGYRERLESKLRHKTTQITRTERLLESLSAEQRPALKPCCRRPLTTGMSSTQEWKNCCKPSKISVSESNIAI